ncbi:MAG: exonuclease subunit SbcD [Vulcanimicrobiota bacterium]
MRLLHTADWHAGRHLSRRGLDEGLEKSLNDLVDYAVREKVDAVLVAGDVFDGTKPPHASQQLVYRTLMRLYLEKIPVAVIAGNHDSVGHWHALKPLFELANVTVVSELSTGSIHTIQTRSGPLHLASLPWPNERLLSPIRFEQSDSDELKLTWADRVRRLVQVLCNKLPPGAPRLLMSHLMVNGSRVSCTERSLSISDTYAVPAEIFPRDLNYVALGHVHTPQTVAAPIKSCYAGSLRPLDFGEAGEARGFYRVEVGVGKPTETEFVELTPGQPLHQIELQRETLEQELNQLAQRPGLYKVLVHLQTPEAGLADLVRRKVPNALMVRTVLTGQSQGPDLIAPEKLLDPLETFRQFHQSEYGCAPEGELVELFLSLLQEDALEIA